MAKRLTGNFSISFNDALAKELGKMPIESRVEVARVVVENAKLTSNQGGSSPFDTGHNRASIGILFPDGKITDRDPKPSAATREGRFRTTAGVKRFARDDRVAVVTTSGYGGFLELGTRSMLPLPYIRPALVKAIRSLQLVKVLQKGADKLERQVNKQFKKAVKARARIFG